LNSPIGDVRLSSRIAVVFHVNPDNIRRKRRLLDCIRAEAASLLEDKHVPLNSFDALRKVLPERQVEAAELMVAMNNFTVSYAKTLLAATPDGQLVPSKRAQTHKGVTEEQLSLMRRESASLDRDFRLIEETYGADHLDLVLAKGLRVDEQSTENRFQVGRTVQEVARQLYDPKGKGVLVDSQSVGFDEALNKARR
jgi:hypothetical protein